MRVHLYLFPPYLKKGCYIFPPVAFLRATSLSIDITPDFMVSLFHLQEGRCYYTGEVLDWNSYGKKHPSSDSMSVDRKDPTIGYVKTNV